MTVCRDVRRRNPQTKCEGLSLAELLSLMGKDATPKTARDALKKLTGKGLIAECLDHPGFYMISETSPARTEKVPTGLRRLLARLRSADR